MPPGARKTNTTKLLLCATLLKCYSQVVSFISHSASIMTPQCKESYLLSSFYHYSYSFFFFKPRFIELPLHDAIFFFLILFNFIYLFLSVLGLRFCARAFSSCGKRGPLFIAVCRPYTITASLVAEHRLQTHRLSSCGSRA